MSRVGTILTAALLARAGAGATLLGAAARPWASITFEGQRHELTLELDTTAVEGFVAGIGELEIALPRHVLIDLAVEHRRDGADGRTRLALGALALADG